MLYALIVPFFFAWSAIFGAKAQQSAGADTAFVGRTLVGFVFLAAYALLFGQGFAGKGFPWLVMGGVLGFGFGDICLFSAYARLGPRMTLLLAQCLAAPFAGLIEWLWLGTLPHFTELLTTAMILIGVGVALGAPTHVHGSTPIRKAAGVMFGVGAALGQALGTVFSRYAYTVNAADGHSVDGVTAAFQRIIGGLLVALVVLAWRRKSIFRPHREKRSWLTASYMLGNGLCGPVFGIGCYQTALLTLPSVIAVGVAATSPIIVIPFAWWLHKDIPSRHSVLGSIIAVAGLIGLVYLRAKTS